MRQVGTGPVGEHEVEAVFAQSFAAPIGHHDFEKDRLAQEIGVPLRDDGDLNVGLTFWVRRLQAGERERQQEPGKRSTHIALTVVPLVALPLRPWRSSRLKNWIHR